MQMNRILSKFLLFSILIPLSCFAQVEWINPSDKIVQTIYYQGMTNSQAQAAKYMGPGGFVATTGEHVVCDKAIVVIQNLYIGQEIDEVRIKAPLAGWNSVCPDILFDKIKRLIIALKVKYTNDGIRILPSNNAKQKDSVQSYSIDLSKINIGQAGDIKNHFNKYQKCIHEYENVDLILYGVSRGAATTFSAMATHNYQNVRLVVLDGCFDSIENPIYPR